jgi:hypothetical protein
MDDNYILDGTSLQCRVIPVTRARQNCSIIWCAETMRAAVVDPGGDLDLVRAAIAAEDLTLERILITHAHNLVRGDDARRRRSVWFRRLHAFYTRSMAGERR